MLAVASALTCAGSGTFLGGCFSPAAFLPLNLAGIALHALVEDDAASPDGAAPNVEPSDEAARETESKSLDLRAARIAIATSVGRAARVCVTSGERQGARVVTLTYEPSGRVSEVRIVPPFAAAPVEACFVDALRDASIAPFEGEATVVRKRFVLAEEPADAASAVDASDVDAAAERAAERQ